ncbi:MAG: hypothetical protein ACTSQY_11100 [Candidatus Odinarchaeia archaeon]
MTKLIVIHNFVNSGNKIPTGYTWRIEEIFGRSCVEVRSQYKYGSYTTARVGGLAYAKKHNHDIDSIFSIQSIRSE